MAKKSENTGRDKKGKFTEGNKISIDNNGGRPSEYKEEYNKLAYDYTLLGATDKQLAEFFGVSESTIDNWKNEYPEFLGSIRAGKEIADMQVAKSFFQNAKGYVTKNLKPIRKKVWDSEAERLVDEIEIVEEIVQHPPNTNAGIFWLKNRQPDKWKDKTEVETTQGQPDLSKLTDKEKAQLLEISRKLNE